VKINLKTPLIAPPEWQSAVIENLRKGGPVCQQAANYLEEHRVPIGFSRQRNTGARWTLRGRIELNARFYSPESTPGHPMLLGAVVHEATHLAQGAATALSVQGEVDAWRAEYLARTELHAPIVNPHWRTVAQTPEPPTDEDLRQARRAILAMAGYRYLIWLLPLRPLGLRCRRNS